MPGNTNLFSPEDIDTLHAISDLSKNDSSFLRTGLELLYKNNIIALREKSVRGFSGKQAKPNVELAETENKTAITPAKLNALKNEYLKRINKLEPKLSAAEYRKRMDKRIIDQKIANAIQNITRKNAKKPSNINVIQIE